MPRPGSLAKAALVLLAVGHQLAAAAPPAEPGSIPVAFEGSALLITYYSGAAEALLERGVVVPGTTLLSGLSGGGYTSALLSLGLNGTAQRDFWKLIISRCTQASDGCAGSLNGHMEDLVADALPEDAADKVNGVTRVALSQLDGSQHTFNGSASWIVDKFADKGDLISVLTGTDFIPCFTGMTTYKLVRNQPVIDGGYANGFKQLCPGGDIKNCIKVASWYVAGQANTTCDPARCGSCAPVAERAEPISTTLFPNNYTYVDQMPIAAVQQRCPAADFASMEPWATMPAFVPHNQTEVDVYPGKYLPLPEWDGQELLSCEWQSWAMMLPKGRELEAMDVAFEYGYASTSAWLDEQGY